MISFLLTPRGALLAGIALTCAAFVVNNFINPLLLQAVIAQSGQLGGGIVSGFSTLVSALGGLSQFIGALMLVVPLVLLKIERVAAAAQQPHGSDES